MMRSDMAKILIDCYRTGGDGGSQKRANRRRFNDESSFEEAQTKGSASAGRQYVDHKELNDHITPLKRYLYAQVGRPWNKVYSEIREHLRMDSVQQRHVLQHVWGYVDKDVVMVGKTPYTTSVSWRGSRPLGAGELYIHPVDGLLKKAKQLPRSETVVRPKTLLISELGMVWYEHCVWRKSTPRILYAGAKYNPFFLTPVLDYRVGLRSDKFGFVEARNAVYGWDRKFSGMYASTKPIALSKTELKKFGLANGNPLVPLALCP